MRCTGNGARSVRWVVAGKPFRDTFATGALADNYRSKLVIAQREGVAFDEACGLPEPMARALNARPWYDHAIAYVDVKWPRASAKHRTGIAEALATVTPTLLPSSRGAPSEKAIRAALYGWSSTRPAATPETRRPNWRPPCGGWSPTPLTCPP
ncbi:hypothetical protein FHX34_104229 [Actinoplanes teichomyceticus]|uniref:Uncharacterized protein n=1 Tax=Actinoplanes teichomyceticus TaxID=1867 RepID=A0A561VQP5_ACTTI|nr:hypothetical protein [Actinoplanes teichomyceticus]TWG13936.1 hypothetical protein FHX34_104229 [Actinoplanes teichomyceticus]GIF12240.1 hypothetical protein Ate01nite_22720 [Actinoplanes teichomyceticus]